MGLLTTVRNLTVNRNRYREHDEAVIISCFFNPQNSQYRRNAFSRFYDSIKHLNHLILECVIGDAQPQLEQDEHIQRVYTENLLWHKEALLNLAVSKLDARYKYVFWVDADVLFTNQHWLTESVAELQAGARIIQPFEYCVHLDKDQIEPDFDVLAAAITMRAFPHHRHPKLWRSFAANYVDDQVAANSRDYDRHGHVGFAWGARREVLEAVPLYDRALIGGADHIIAHAAAGQVPHTCIQKSFTEDIDAVNAWSWLFYGEVQGRIAYAKGDLYHLWHGDIEKRQYLKRIQEFTPTTKKIVERDKNGLYVTRAGDDKYVKHYFAHREVQPTDDGFMTSMGTAYMTDSPALGMVLGGNPAGAIIGGALRPHHHDDSHTGGHAPPAQQQGHRHAPENFS